MLVSPTGKAPARRRPTSPLHFLKVLPGIKLSKNVLLMIAAAAMAPPPTDAYYFEGYYVPVCLISPMKDEQVYTPAGMGVVTSRAGFRTHPVTGRGDFHNGVDLAANLNDKVYELLDGYVTRVGYKGNIGVMVEVYHPYPNILTITGHLNGYTVKPGMWVRRGQVIGFAGSTGRSTGVHVHYTVIKNDTNQYIEPLKYLTQVPSYVLALKTARVQAAIAANTATFKKKQAEKAAKGKVDEDDDLPADGKKEETAPPKADRN
jgi:murein DD-endopeptidase MepM/ murein hydrolase activator NlpD